ncbi:MAG TPA: ABC transporter ATP-binding protein [Clostridiales bacterium]|mgnify:CR=1 FL=1|nr:ABC transporter ATP-binding protein [Clostridiales bacterium]
MSVIEIKNLTRDYKKGKGVFDISFDVEEGEVFGFLGPNGAGKTTTIRHLMGFIRPQNGSCKIKGLDCWHDRARIQQNLGYVPGEMSFFDDMTGIDFLNFSAKYRGVKANGRMLELIDRFELDPKGKLKKMSKGMKQKVGIVAAFMHDPDVLILDEPTSGLDPLMQSRFIEMIIEEKKRGKTILMSSHMFEEVERTCHRVSIIRNGHLVAVDAVDKLKAKRVKTYVITLDSEEAAEAFAKENITVTSVFQNNVTVAVQSNIKDLIALMNKYPVSNISAPNQSLEEIFMQYYGGEKNA